MASSLSALMAAIRAPTMVVSAPPPLGARVVGSFVGHREEGALPLLPPSVPRPNPPPPPPQWQQPRKQLPNESFVHPSLLLRLRRAVESGEERGGRRAHRSRRDAPSLPSSLREKGRRRRGRATSQFFWSGRRRSFVERQPSHVWANQVGGAAALFFEGEDRGGGGLLMIEAYAFVVAQKKILLPPLLAGLLLDTLPPSVGTYTHVRRAHPQLSSPITLLLPF